MKLKQLFITICLLGFAITTKAQEYNPFKSIGKKAKVLTLSHGKYVEFFDTDSIQRIGTVMINTRTKKIVKLLKEEDVHKKTTDNTSVSRWYSPDPMSESYSSLTPYNLVANNPINGIDPDGRDIIFLNASTGANGFGHAAVIIGNSIDGWFYYSLNGTKDHSAVGDSYKPDIGTPLGHGSDINKLVLDANEVNKEHIQKYDRYVSVKTTPEEDRAMKVKAAAAAAIKKYLVVGSSCIDVNKAAYSSLASTRIGLAHGIIDKSALSISVPNLWTQFLPSVIKRDNFYISLFGGDRIEPPAPKKTPVIIVHPLDEE